MTMSAMIPAASAKLCAGHFPLSFFHLHTRHIHPLSTRLAALYRPAAAQ